MSVILVEGPDGGGKTHVAQHVFAKAGYSYQHNGPPEKGWSPAEIFWWQLRGLQGETTQWVVDRNWPSEQIYHRFAHRPNVFHPFAQRMFERYMLAHQGVVVMCLPPYGVARDAWKTRAEAGQELITDERDFATMYAFYSAWRSTTCLYVDNYDWTAEGPRVLRERLEQHTRYAPENPYPGIVYGNPGANILVVGEQYNVNGRPEGPHIPFVGTGRNGFWLAEQLEIAGLKESDLMWVNCLSPRGVKESPELITKLQPRVILALGKVAATWAQLSGSAKVLEVPHPAFWTRFHGKEVYPLQYHALFLREVAREF